MRANVISELIKSEQEYVKHLRNIVEGYLYPARRRPDLFTGGRIKTIFSNIEQLYEFQKQFLKSLESCINWSELAESRVGKCFLQYEEGFSVYHHYCNNHPNASSELQELYTKPSFVKFFEACRLLQNMIDISLDGFLLTPIQRICKYPLQLNELLKNTDKEHPDYLDVLNALESMKNCANRANERKRRIEALTDVISFQEKVDNWFGPKLSDTSSILIHSGEVTKVSSSTWSQGVQLYLFDHLLLYTKRDLLKGNTLILRGRISMDSVTEISDADEYKPKRSFKLYCDEQKKWFVFTTRSEHDKDEWIRAFERERSLVESDENDGFHITIKEIGIARRTLQNRKHTRSARYPRNKRPDTAIGDQIDVEEANAIMNRTLSLPSCIHPSHVLNFCEESRVLSTGNNQNNNPNIGGSGSGTTSNTNNNINLKMKFSPQQNPHQLPTSTTHLHPNQLGQQQHHQLHNQRQHQNNQHHMSNQAHGQFSSESQPHYHAHRTSGNFVVADHAQNHQLRKHKLAPQPPVKTSSSSSKLLTSDTIMESPMVSVDQQQECGTGDRSYEATMVLSSGRVVRVREDAV